MNIKIMINPGTDNEAVIQGNFPEMKEFLENSLRFMLKWMSGETMSRFPSDTEKWIYHTLDAEMLEETAGTCDNCKFYDECPEEWYQDQGGCCEEYEPQEN